MLVIAVEHPARTADDVVALVAENSLRAGVPAGDETLVVRADDGEVGELIDDGQNELFGVVRGRTGLPLRGVRSFVDNVDEEWSAVVAAGDGAGHFHLPVLPLLLDDAFVDAVAARIAAEHPLEQRRFALGIIGMGEVGECHPRELLRRVAGELAEPLVVLQPRAVDGDQSDTDRSVLKRLAEPCLPMPARYRRRTGLAHERDHLIDGRELDHGELYAAVWRRRRPRRHHWCSGRSSPARPPVPHKQSVIPGTAGSPLRSGCVARRRRRAPFRRRL